MSRRAMIRGAVLIAIGLMAGSSVSACPFQTDADVANALAGTHWLLRSERHYTVQNNRISIHSEPRETQLTISPTLRASQLAARDIDLVFHTRDMPEHHSWQTGNVTMRDRYPVIEDAPCRAGALSMLEARAPTVLERRQAELILELWIADQDRMSGLLRIERMDAFGQLHALIEPITAARAEP